MTATLVVLNGFNKTQDAFKFSFCLTKEQFKYVLCFHINGSISLLGMLKEGIHTIVSTPGMINQCETQDRCP